MRSSLSIILSVLLALQPSLIWSQPRSEERVDYVVASNAAPRKKAFLEIMNAKLEQMDTADAPKIDKRLFRIVFELNQDLDDIADEASSLRTLWATQSTLNGRVESSQVQFLSARLINLKSEIERTINKDSMEITGQVDSQLIEHYFVAVQQILTLKMLVSEKLQLSPIEQWKSPYELQVDREAYLNIHPMSISRLEGIEYIPESGDGDSTLTYRIRPADHQLLGLFLTAMSERFRPDRPDLYMDVVKCLTNNLMLGKYHSIQGLLHTVGRLDPQINKLNLCPGVNSEELNQSFQEFDVLTQGELDVRAALLSALPHPLKGLSSRNGSWKDKRIKVANTWIRIMTPLFYQVIIRPHQFSLEGGRKDALTIFEMEQMRRQTARHLDEFKMNNIYSMGSDYYNFWNEEINKLLATFFREIGYRQFVDDSLIDREAEEKQQQRDFQQLVFEKMHQAELIMLSGVLPEVISSWPEPFYQLMKSEFLHAALPRLLIDIKKAAMRAALIHVFVGSGYKELANRSESLADSFYRTHVEAELTHHLEDFFASATGKEFVNEVVGTIETKWKSTPSNDISIQEYVLATTEHAKNVYKYAHTGDLSELPFNMNTMKLALSDMVHGFDPAVSHWLDAIAHQDFQNRFTQYNSAMEHLRSTLAESGVSMESCDSSVILGYLKMIPSIGKAMLGFPHSKEPFFENTELLQKRYCEVSIVGSLFGLTGFSSEPQTIQDIKPELDRRLGQERSHEVVEAYRKSLIDSEYLAYRTLGLEMKGADTSDMDKELPLYEIMMRFYHHYVGKEVSVLDADPEKFSTYTSHVIPWIERAMIKTEANIISQLAKISAAKKPEDITLIVRDSKVVNKLLGEDQTKKAEYSLLNMLRSDSGKAPEVLEGLYPGLLAYHQKTQANLAAKANILEGIWDEFTYYSLVPLGWIILWWLTSRVHPALGGAMMTFTSGSISTVAGAYLTAFYGILGADTIALANRKLRLHRDLEEYTEMSFTEAERSDLPKLLRADSYSNQKEFIQEYQSELNFRIGSNLFFMTLPVAMRKGAQYYNKHIKEPRLKRENNAFKKAYEGQVLTDAEQKIITHREYKMQRRVARLNKYHYQDFRLLGFREANWSPDAIKSARDAKKLEYGLRGNNAKLAQVESAYERLIGRLNDEFVAYANSNEMGHKLGELFWKTKNTDTLNHYFVRLREIFDEIYPISKLGAAK